MIPAAGAGAVVRRPGRPRDAELEGLAITATLALIDAEEEVTVSRVVARSGVSRAALYRRWPSLSELIAAALDVGRSVSPPLPTEGDLRETVYEALFGAGPVSSLSLASGSDARFRHRIRLVMGDRELQRVYWETHVTRRRAPIESALAAGVEQGLFLADLDVAACFDALAGVAYYQAIVRGEQLTEPATIVRLRAAFNVIWRGMLA